MGGRLRMPYRAGGPGKGMTIAITYHMKEGWYGFGIRRRIYGGIYRYVI